MPKFMKSLCAIVFVVAVVSAQKIGRFQYNYDLLLLDSKITSLNFISLLKCNSPVIMIAKD